MHICAHPKLEGIYTWLTSTITLKIMDKTVMNEIIGIMLLTHPISVRTEISRCNAEASKANLERPWVRRQTRNTPKETNLTWFGQSTYVHKGDEQSTINMRVQNIERNNLNKFTRNTRRYTKFSPITTTLKTLGLHCEC